MLHSVTNSMKFKFIFFPSFHKTNFYLFFKISTFREIESTARHRRQSAPPPISQNFTASPNRHRDEAYIRAIAKFNEYRNHQRFERLNETKNTSAITQSEMNKTVDDISITDVEIKDTEKKRLIKSRNGKSDSLNQHNTVLYSNCNPPDAKLNKLDKRLSLPIIKDRSYGGSTERRRVKIVQTTSTIDEIEEFEHNHCQKFTECSFENPSTPPRKFYRNNSDPYDADKSQQILRKPTPKRLMGKSMLRRNKGKAPQPPQIQAKLDQASESSTNFYNGNFKHYDMSSASIFDNYVISSKAYKGNLRKEVPEKINSVGESASSGSLSSNPIDPDKEVKKQRRLSPPYQTVINKHGDEVEYALPYNERDSLLNIPPLPAAPAPTVQAIPFDQFIDQNFKFLNSKLDFLNSQIDHGDRIDMIDASFSDIRRQNLQVTDLDRSNDTGLAIPNSGDIMKDLETLSKWSQNVQKGNNDEALTSIQQYKAIQNNIKIFNSHDIKYKSGTLRNAFSTPLEFSNGYFHQTPVTLRSTLPNLYSISNFADNACKHEFEIIW